jgi:serine/threonine-protein kinase
MQSGPGGFKRLVVLRPVNDSVLIPVANIDPQLPVPHGVEDLDGGAFAAYDFFPGATLKEITSIYRSQDQLPPLGLVARLVIDAARILNVAHTHQDALGGTATFVHGGLSDSLLLMGFDGLVRVLDFGVRGINRFSAPEAVRGGPFDARSDVFSLAAVLHAALTGFTGSYVQVLQRTPSAQEFPPPSAVHPDARPDLDVLVMHSLMPERERRMGSLNDVANDLERLVGASLPQPQACATRIRQLFEERLDRLRNFVPRLESDLTAQRFRPSRPQIPVTRLPEPSAPRRTGERPKLEARNVDSAFESDQDEATIVKVEPPVHVPDEPDEATLVKIDAAPVEAPGVVEDDMDRFDKTDVINPSPSLLMKAKRTSMQPQLDASMLKRTVPHVDVPWAPTGSVALLPPDDMAPEPTPAEPLLQPPSAPLLEPLPPEPDTGPSSLQGMLAAPPPSDMVSAVSMGSLGGTSDEERAAALGQEIVPTGSLPAVKMLVAGDEAATGKVAPAHFDNFGVVPDVADLKTVVKVTGGHPKVQLPLEGSDDTGRILKPPVLQEVAPPRRRSPVPIVIIVMLLAGIGGGFGYMIKTRPAMVREKFQTALIKWHLKKPPPPPPDDAEQQAAPPQGPEAAALTPAVGVDGGEVAVFDAGASARVVDAGHVDAGQGAQDDDDLDGGEEEEDDAGASAYLPSDLGHGSDAGHVKKKKKKHPKAWWQTH